MGTESSIGDRLETLRSIPLFADLSQASLESILEFAAEFEAQRGHVLVQPNQPGAGLFIIEEGVVEVELPNRKLELGAGEFFGELALLDAGATRTARIRVVKQVRCLAIARAEFDRLLQSEPKMAISMLRTLARRLAAQSKEPPRGRTPV
jgi:CRP-like cAMP-binding protein